MTREQAQRMIRQLAKEGRVEFAPPPPPELVPPIEFCRQFAQEILHQDWDRIFVSEMSDLLDFGRGSREAYLADLKRVYGTDCSDMRDLNLWRVMQRCREGGHC